MVPELIEPIMVKAIGRLITVVVLADEGELVVHLTPERAEALAAQFQAEAFQAKYPVWYNPFVSVVYE